MQLYNDTPFAVSTTVFKSEPREPFLTLIVKGTFALVPDARCESLPAARQDPPQAATAHEDEHGNSLRTDAEMAPFKPRADCLLVGTCYTPGGRPAQAATAVFEVGPMRKTLWIYGDRYWERTANGKFTSSPPEPFVTMPIRNEFAHGGYASTHNKHGRGMIAGDPREMLDDTIPLANVQNHRDTHVTPTADRVPAGFGPLDPGMPPRRDLLGTYDDDWLYKRKPLPPRDFSYAHFNAARLDQQVDGYLRGDEPLYLENLHPVHAQIRAWLPGVAVRCFLLHVSPNGEQPRLDLLEAPAHLDTCAVDMEAATVTLIWRARAPLDPTERDQFTHALIAQEPVGAPIDEAAYRQRLKTLILAEAGIDAASADAEGPGKEPDQEKDAAARAVSARMVDIFEQGKAPAEMIDIVKRNPDPMAALQDLLSYAKDLVRKLPKEPK